MKITSISAQVKNQDRVNISVDGKYRFSLDLYQVSEIGIRIGNEYTEDELTELETESQFGKLYSRALEYTMIRPHSAREIRDYLWRKTRDTKYKTRQGDVKDRPGVSQELTERVFSRLLEKGYISDEKFTRWWVETRNQTKGTSRRKLEAELRGKGVDSSLISAAFENTERNDIDELKKIIAKKSKRYADQQKLMQYLARQGFSYDSIKAALTDSQDD